KLYVDWKRLPEAEQAALQAIEKHQQVHGHGHYHDVQRLGEIYQLTNRLNEARDQMRLGLTLRAKALGPRDPDSVRVRLLLAQVLQALRRADERVVLLAETYAIARRLPGDDELRYQAGDQLTAAYYRGGKHVEAARTIREVVADSDKHRGETHPESLRLRLNLGFVLSGKKEYAEAERALRRVLEVAPEKLGANHRVTRMTIDQLGAVNWNLGKLDEADRLMQQTLSYRQETLGADNRNTLGAMTNLGMIRNEAGRYGEAVPLLEQSVQGKRKVLRPGDPWYRYALGALIEAYVGAGRQQDAEALLEEALKLQQPLVNTPNPTPDDCGQMAWLMLFDGEEAKAALVWAQRACERDPDASRLFTLARAQWATGDREGAEASFRRAVEAAPEGKRARYRERWDEVRK
ncbi:MAG: tetratricopeptide repeat protein, partial [Planctomycetota bacterium]